MVALRMKAADKTVCSTTRALLRREMISSSLLLGIRVTMLRKLQDVSAQIVGNYEITSHAVYKCKINLQIVIIVYLYNFNRLTEENGQ